MKPAELPTSYQSVCQRLGLGRDLPVTKDWSATPEFLAIIAEHCLSVSPDVIVECSSGATTLVLAQCCRLSGNSGHVFSLENGLQYADRTRQNLEDFSLQAYASVIHAPLVDTRAGDDTFQWYQTDELKQQVSGIDCLVIDGPPGFIQKQSRYPALPALFSLLAEDAVIFLDDAAREDEKQLVQRWLSEFPGLELEYIDVPRGCAILSRTRSG